MIFLNVFFVIFSGLMMTSVQAADELEEIGATAIEEAVSGEGYWSSWFPTNYIANVAGQAAKKAVEESQSGLNQVAQENIKLAGEVSKEVIDKLADETDLLLVKTRLEAQAFVNHLLQEKVVNDAMKSVHKIADEAQVRFDVVIAGAADKLKDTVEPIGHQLTVDLAQNMGKMLLSSAIGIFGVCLVYKNLVDYFAAQDQIDTITFDGQQALLLPKMKLICLRHQQQRNMYGIGAGAVSLATACVLCCYWIR